MTGKEPDWCGSGGRRLHLASVSPRRSLLLREAGFEHTAGPAPIDDSEMAPGGADPASWVAALAYLKARSALDALRRDGARGVVVLAADTVVVKAGRVIGKPADRADAERILRSLERGTHRVLTGAAILREDGLRSVFSDGARVEVGEIGEDRLRDYLESGQWQGKAGAYNLSERLRAGWPIVYEGDPGTIMGLPMRRLAPLLRRTLDDRPERGAA